MIVQEELLGLMKRIAAKVTGKQFASEQGIIKANVPEIKLTECKATGQEVNLFKETSFFNDAYELYFEVNKVNALAKQSYTDFCLLVEETRKKSNGAPGGISTKIPVNTSEQFKVMLRIMEKLFKKEIDAKRTTKIITKINERLKVIEDPKIQAVVREIMTVWNDEITDILKKRNKKKWRQNLLSVIYCVRNVCISQLMT